MNSIMAEYGYIDDNVHTAFNQARESLEVFFTNTSISKKATKDRRNKLKEDQKQARIQALEKMLKCCDDIDLAEMKEPDL